MGKLPIILVASLLAVAPVGVAAVDEEASAGGRFEVTGAPSESRVIHAAAPLSDGRVLVTGGWYSLTRVAEAWDPATGAFERAGRLAEPRAAHSMTALGDGRVLVVGGPGGPGSEGFSDSAELWDPDSQSFEPTGSLSQARAMHTATRLDDGRVLVIGGTDGDRARSLAEAWDPVTGSFAPAGSLARGRASHTATLLADGRVLVVGGWDWRSEPALASAEVWDPATETFAPAGTLLHAREHHTATRLEDGRVLVVGGRHRSLETADTAMAETWDPATATFAPAGTLAEHRLSHTATLLPDGRVLVIGGLDPVTEVDPTVEGHGLATAELWDPATASFGPGGVMDGATAMHTATLLEDGRVLVVGSFYGDDEELISMARTWEPLAR